MLIERENEEIVALLPAEQDRMVNQMLSQEGVQLYIDRKSGTVTGLDADGYVFTCSLSEFTAVVDRMGDN